MAARMIDGHENGEPHIERSNLWLAKTLFDLGGVSFGDFTLGRTTVHSPLYINPRVLISEPAVLRMVAQLIEQETVFGKARKRPRCSPFDLVAGVPLGGLHLATAFTLATNVPMVYVRDGDFGRVIEGRYRAGQTVLIIDDLITTGGSVLDTGSILEQAGLRVRDVIVLIDREQGASRRLKRHGYNLIPILRLKTILNYYLNAGLIGEDWYYRSMAYIEAHQAE